MADSHNSSNRTPPKRQPKNHMFSVPVGDMRLTVGDEREPLGIGHVLGLEKFKRVIEPVMTKEVEEEIHELEEALVSDCNWKDCNLAPRYQNVLETDFLQYNLRPDVTTSDSQHIERRHFWGESVLMDFEKRLSVHLRRKELEEAVTETMRSLGETFNEERDEDLVNNSFSNAWRGGANGKSDRMNMADRLSERLSRLHLENFGPEGAKDYIALSNLLEGAKKAYRGLLTFDELRRFAETLKKYGLLWNATWAGAGASGPEWFNLNWYIYAAVSEPMADPSNRKMLFDKYQLRQINKVYRLKAKTRGVDFANIEKGWDFTL